MVIEFSSNFLRVYRILCCSCWIGEGEESGSSPAVVRDLRVARATVEDLAALETCHAPN